jgi:hypothetical protein
MWGKTTLEQFRQIGAMTDYEPASIGRNTYYISP